MVSSGTGVFMNLMHPLTNHQCLGMCLTQGSAKSVQGHQWHSEVGCVGETNLQRQPQNVTEA